MNNGGNNMKVEIITSILMFTLISIVPSIITKVLLKDKDTLSINEEEFEGEFRVLWWLYPMACLVLIVGISLLYAGINSSRSIGYYLRWEEVIVIVLGASVILCSIFMIIGLVRMRISINERMFIYNNGFKIKYKIPIKQIKSVMVENGNLVINDGDEYPKLVSIYFKDIKTVVKVLNERTNRSKAK
ncbi:hypothetical protein NEOCIP111885_01371 [Pseudoneobacillus rhizosphaerae]|uniref:Uncharacterized protein n=2 Tax=Pseudoneobacillus rhizosphaerae TaxID=2880968 RepID=A0A9C7G8C1_9BACI|nr:hypothetical protein NEOCIP111885_01371 [Pseudoneobacillus rhizosphaerae]